MRRPRPSPWIFLIAVAFVGYFCLLVYCDIVRPEPQGLDILSFTPEGGIISEVAPASPEDRAGLRAGDLLVSVDGRPVRNRFDIETIGYTVELGRSRRYQVVRAGTPLTAVVTLSRTTPNYFLSRAAQVLLGMRLVMFVTLLFGIVIATVRPRDPAALLGALLLASTGVFSVTLPYRIAIVWRALPLALGVWLWVPFFCTMGIGAVAFAFYMIFPARRGLFGRWTIAILAPMAVVAGAQTLTLMRTVYRPEDLGGSPSWLYRSMLGVNAAYIVAGLGVLIGTYRRLADRTQQRRVRVLVAGSLVGWLAIMPGVAEFYARDADLRRSLFASPGITIGALVFLAFPISFAYSILRQRLMDLSGIVRLGVQYALARRALLSLVPALVLVLVFDFVLHAERPVREVVAGHGLIYVFIAAIGVLAHRQRGRWLTALDRRFFRERYNARQVLGRLVADIRQTASFDQVAPRAAAEIEAALHPQFVAVFVRPALGSAFSPAVIIPPHRPTAPFRQDSTVLRLMRVLKKPMEIGFGESAWIATHLPPAEIEEWRDARVELVVPIVVDETRAEAVLVLGVKRSEEPYSGEDQELLVAIAESLALLFDRVAPPAEAVARGIAECPSCGLVYDTGTAECTEDGARLVPARAPRLLASRYRLERRLGRGGMGTVYAATDTALHRVVAAKVLRDEWMDNAGAIERFQAEARAVARLTHPNVVTIHDVGVIERTTGFLIMELLHGTSLRAALQLEPRMTPSRVVAILRDVSSAIDVAHRASVVHRDLKPENVFLVQQDAGEIAKVVDFGIAKSVRPGGADGATYETNPGAIVGTPRYMAPEQLAGRDPQPSWDLWALTVVGFEMLTGTHPFASVPAWVGPGFATGEAALPESPLAELPPSWATFFTRALSIDPARRPASARELFAEFEDAVTATSAG